MSVNYQKAPFPWRYWFGGKSKAAPAVWEALGDVDHYVEPFAGSLAVLLGRPHLANRSYHSETVGDLDGLLVNVWRSIQQYPEETAAHASWPVSEADLHARHLALVRWRDERNLEHLMGDPGWCDPRMAGWWLWGICCWIGSGWCSGTGAWTADDGGDLVKQARGPVREPGVGRQLPHLGDDGRGVNRPVLREPGVKRQRPHLSSNGQGVTHAGTREPGVERTRPHLGNGGMGVNRPQLREPGVGRQRPHLGDNGMGVNHAGTREPGTEFHDMTMPELVRWFQFLAARLRHVRIVNGTWKRTIGNNPGEWKTPPGQTGGWGRLVTNGATKNLSVRGGGVCGIVLDPPYADTADRADGLYAQDSLTVAHEVADWCVTHGDDPEYRIVLCGLETEHGNKLADAGWTELEWYKEGHLTGGMANTGTEGHQQHRERIWTSPHCLTAEPSDQGTLFG